MKKHYLFLSLAIIVLVGIYGIASSSLRNSKKINDDILKNIEALTFT